MISASTRLLGARLDLRVGEHVAQRRGRREGGDEVAQLAAHRLDDAGLLGGVEQGLGVDPSDLLFAHALPSAPSFSTSSSASASSMRRCWSAALRLLAATFSVASAVSSAIWPLMLAQRGARVALDLLVRLLEHALGLRLGLGHDLGLGVLAGGARALEDLLGLAAHLGERGLVLLEQAQRLGARLLGHVHALLDAVAPLVDDLLQRPEGVLPEDEHGDAERDQRPDHQARVDVQHAASSPAVAMGATVARSDDEDEDQGDDESVQRNGLGDADADEHVGATSPETSGWRAIASSALPIMMPRPTPGPTAPRPIERPAPSSLPLLRPFRTPW